MLIKLPLKNFVKVFAIRHMRAIMAEWNQSGILCFNAVQGIQMRGETNGPDLNRGQCDCCEIGSVCSIAEEIR